jgi:hypothetical protein
VVTSELPVERTGSLLSARAPRAGSFSITLDDRRPWDAEIDREPPATIALRRWRLRAPLRAYDGSTTVTEMDLDALADWRRIEQLRHCSSQGVYTTAFALDESYVEEGVAVELDLGHVHDVAEVEVNGRKLAPLLVFPYACDVSRFLRVGQNVIRVAVTPALRNRLVGYGDAGIKACRQFKGRELSPAGMMGPVTLTPVWRIPLAT